MPRYAFAAFAACLVAAGGVAAQDTASATMTTVSGAEAGVVELIQTPHGVLIAAELRNLEEGEHGFHIHETGDCGDDFAAAGDHFAPEGNEHGFTNPNGPHGGDLPSLFVNGDGQVTAHVFNSRIALTGGESAVMDDDGATMMVHAQPDSYAENAGAGDRVACGVIEQ